MRQALALHPSLAHGGAFAGLTAAMPEFALTAPDMIGHGRAPNWDGRGDIHTLCTRDAIAIAAQMQGPIDLIGHSFGATVALRLALERPELLRSIVLIEPVLFAAARADEAPEYRAFAQFHDAFDADLRGGRMQDAARQFQAIWGDGRDFDALPRRLQGYITQRIPLIAAQTAALRDDSAGIMGYLRLESLGLPVLLISGSDSPPIIAAIHRALAARLPNVTQQTVAGARHMLPITHPKDAARLIIDFLNAA